MPLWHMVASGERQCVGGAFPAARAAPWPHQILRPRADAQAQAQAQALALAPPAPAAAQHCCQPPALRNVIQRDGSS
ncbi:Protein of unknown function [Gryllus bimaculatus]|nr:Protein of unknown function [Gryllus bimaculatus]